MKDIRFDISLYIIIPVIFAGIALLATLASYNVAVYYLKRGLDPTWPVAFWGTITIVVTAIFGLLIVKFIIDPVKQFAESTQELAVFSNASNKNLPPVKTDDMGRFTQIFNQVTEILSQVEARELFPEIVGQSQAMRAVLKQILDVAKTDSTVLILGETGTGKELIAKSIHRHSLRRNNPFVAFNCAAIPEGLLESELFGHEKGAFTGAVSKKIGKFEAADKSTLFMDEIGDMPLETQAKVLRAIQESQFERVGGVKPVSFDARLITATNKQIDQLVELGRFRQDLYFRLNVFTIGLPPLRNRREDIPLLVDHFLESLDGGYRMSSEAMQLLTAYHWPGNVRELENAVEAATVLAQDMIEPRHLPSGISMRYAKTGSASQKIDPLSSDQDLDHRLRELEKGIIIDALKQTDGVQKHAADLLGIKERSLWHRIKKYEIDVASFKQQNL
ncbi:MAG: sigma 54-interacting transcriptional regulator [Deltaproteobacteria bacterium]|nr:sigma 54-interacting transcriptional regulator [Deltaproteobacteria bacterium]